MLFALLRSDFFITWIFRFLKIMLSGKHRKSCKVRNRTDSIHIQPRFWFAEKGENVSWQRNYAPILGSGINIIPPRICSVCVLVLILFRVQFRIKLHLWVNCTGGFDESVNFSFLKNSQVQINFKLNKKKEYDYLLKGHCHAIWQLYKKLEGVFASIEFQNLVIEDYLKVLKLFPVDCRYGWHGWKWIETWKN